MKPLIVGTVVLKCNLKKRRHGIQIGMISTLLLNAPGGEHPFYLALCPFMTVLRPICWSQSSVIFTASLTQPTITGRHFSSSKTFVLPSPSPILSSPASYESPSIITVAAGDEWLFAYFPRYDGDGTGCLWKRGPQIDNWAVKDFWSFSCGGGVVAASWLGCPREVSNCTNDVFILNILISLKWANSASYNLARLPPRGPRALISNPMLVLVTQDHHVHVTYIRQYHSSLATMKRLLTSLGITKEQLHTTDTVENPRSNRQCMEAAIGLGYDGRLFHKRFVHELNQFYRDINSYSHIFTPFTGTSESNSARGDTI